MKRYIRPSADWGWWFVEQNYFFKYQKVKDLFPYSLLFLHQYYQIGQVWYDNARELSIFSLFVLSLPAEVLQVLQYMYRVHDPTITIAIGSVWLQLSSERVSLGAWKIARQTPWFLMMVIYRYLGRKNYTCNLRMKVINLKREKMFLCYVVVIY